jgi:hypothetical protein
LLLRIGVLGVTGIGQLKVTFGIFDLVERTLEHDAPPAYAALWPRDVPIDPDVVISQDSEAKGTLTVAQSQYPAKYSKTHFLHAKLPT